VVHPNCSLNRDEVKKQEGHKIIVNFKQPIVNHLIKYEEDKKKSKGYNVVNCQKNLDDETLSILKGSRGVNPKKSSEFRYSKIGTSNTNSLLWFSFYM